MFYRLVLRAFGCLVLLLAFWPELRFGQLTYFDWISPVFVAAALPYRSSEPFASVASFKTPFAAVVLLMLAGYASLASSWDGSEHVLKLAQLLLAYCTMLALVYVLSTKGILSLVTALNALCVSGAVSSIVCILQGQFGLLTSLMRPGPLEPWMRMNGMTEYPIEAGIVSSYAAVIAVGLAVASKRWRSLPYIALAVLCLYSMKYSASLTAIFGIAAGIFALALVARSSRLLVVLLLCTVLVITIALPAGMLGPLTSRLEGVAEKQGNYETVQTRAAQWDQTLQLIDGRTVLFGNGFSPTDLPGGDIHNGILSAIFHFGVLGLASQLLLLWFFVSKLFGTSPRVFRGILLGCLVIFSSAYLTGPAYARRSLWIPVLLIGAYLPARRTHIAHEPISTPGHVGA